MSLFQRLGGQEAISAVVDKFYQLMLQDNRVSHFYTNIDLQKLRTRQKQFLAMVTGGPANYLGSDMKTAHCKLAISHKDFDATWENLESALKHFEVGQLLINEVKSIFYSVQGDIIKQGEILGQKGHNSIENNDKKCPFSGKSNQQGQNCPLKLSRNPYLKHFY